MSSRTLVTGAGGFIGVRVCAEIIARGEAVRALVRTNPPGIAGVDLAWGELLHRETVRQAMVGVDTVMHFAARVHQLHDDASDPAAEYRRVNVDGTRILLEEAQRAGVRAFVFASSIKAVTGEHLDGVVDDRTPPRPTDPYGVSKRDAERAVHEYAAAMRTAVLRLPLTYGPGVKANMLTLLRLVDRGVPLPLAGVQNRRSQVFVGNVASAAITVAHAPLAAGGTFFVTDGPAMSTAQFVRAIARALGRRPRIFTVPRWALRLLALAGDAASFAVRTPFNSAVLSRLTGSLDVDDSRLRAIGWTPPYSLEQGLDETVAWYREQPRSRHP